MKYSSLFLALAVSGAGLQARADFFDIFRPEPRRPQQYRPQPQHSWWEDDDGPAYDEEYLKSVTPKPKSVDVAPFSESDFQTKPWLKSFRYVVVVNKANTGTMKQTVTLYEDGNKIKVEKTSTGREIFEKARETEEEHRPDTPYYSITPTGYFVAKWLSKDHKSSSWKTPMPWAVFFDLDNGIALHEVPPAYKNILGQRASGGCVRLSPAFAQEMFERVQKTRGAMIPKINQDGTPVLDKKGEVVYSNTTLLYDNVREPAYSALIIVQDVK